MEFLHLLENIRTPFGDGFFSVLTFLLGEAAVIVLFAINFWCADKNLAYNIGFVFFGSSTIIQTVKITMRVPRPFVRDPSLKPVKSALKGASGYSFPSGHTQTATSVFTPCAAAYRKRWWISAICFVLIALTAFSRLYLGVHTPEDVLFGFLFAFVCSVIVFALRAKFGDKWIIPAAAVLVVASVGAVIYGVVLMNTGTITYEFLLDTIKNSAACLGFAIGAIIERRFINFNPENTTLKQGVIRSLVGVAIGLLLMYGPKLFASGILVVDGLRYFAAILWIVCIYPLIIKKYSEKKKEKAKS